MNVFGYPKSINFEENTNTFYELHVFENLLLYLIIERLTEHSDSKLFNTNTDFFALQVFR